MLTYERLTQDGNLINKDAKNLLFGTVFFAIDFESKAHVCIHESLLVFGSRSNAGELTLVLLDDREKLDL